MPLWSHGFIFFERNNCRTARTEVKAAFLCPFADTHKIPEDEQAVTKKNLEAYERELAAILKRRRD